MRPTTEKRHEHSGIEVMDSRPMDSLLQAMESILRQKATVTTAENEIARRKSNGPITA